MSNKEKIVNLKELKEDYLRLLEESFQQTAEFNKGDVIEGVIATINDNFMVINLGGKFDAYADVNEYADENGKLGYAVGDTLKGFIVDRNDQGFVIGKSLTKQYVNKDGIKEAFEKKIPVQGKVYAVTKGGFSVDIFGARAFCPMSQISYRFAEDNSQFIGKNMDFEIIECSENCRKLVVSHRILEEKVNDEKKAQAMEKLAPEQTVKGKVMRMTNFGAFVDLGGVEGLLHVSEISWHHIVRPQDALTTGQEIEVKILKMDGEKISLSMRALQENPFAMAMKEMKEGDIINCRVLRLHNFGAFVELKPGVEGLIPVSEMSRTRMIGHPKEILKEGDYVEVQILRIDDANQKISLSLKALQKDPWDEIDEVLEVGKEMNGRVESATNFGVFVTLSDGITGLLPRSRVRKQETYKPGDEITLTVTAVDKEQRRISLDYTDAALHPVEQEEFQRRDDKDFRNKDSKPRKSRERNEEWRRYANQKPEGDDNPFKDL
ncbi:MAG: S1 RNA-binding domain-containing protein [Candidatus Cloacimonadaceae bacterium]